MDLKEIGFLALKVLASVGGAGIGLFATGWGLRGLSHLIAHRPPPAWLLWSRWLGGAAAGAAVWIFAFGPGGGFGWGGGSGAGSGSGENVVLSTESPSKAADDSSPPPKTNQLLGVRLVRSKEYESDSKRYFRVEDEPAMKTVAEVIALAKSRLEQNPASKTLELFIYQDSVSDVWGMVDDLKERARPLGLTVNTHKMDHATP